MSRGEAPERAGEVLVFVGLGSLGRVGLVEITRSAPPQPAVVMQARALEFCPLHPGRVPHEQVRTPGVAVLLCSPDRTFAWVSRVLACQGHSVKRYESGGLATHEVHCFTRRIEFCVYKM